MSTLALPVSTPQSSAPAPAASPAKRAVFDPGLQALRRQGDLYMLLAAGLHAGVLVAVGWAYGQIGAALLWAGTLSALALGAFLTARGTWVNSVLLPLLLVGFVAGEIHFGVGKPEFHFGVFVTLSYLLVYRHPLPILVGAGGFAVHHLVFDRLQALGYPLYCLSQPSLEDVFMHAGYVVAQAGVGVAMALHMRRDARLMSELESLTTSLAARGGSTVDFQAVALPVRTATARRLQGMLDQVRQAVATVRDSVTEVATASRELAMGNQDLSQRTEQSAAGLQSTASALQSYTGQLGGSVHGIREMAERARLSQQAAQDGARSADELDRRMGAITAGASRIREITATIDTIAFQTNILALNAAVESARAGEAGRGFAVVAGEVRLLAQRSAAAAREVRQLIESSVHDIAAGATVAANTRAMLVDIDTQAREVAVLADGLSSSLARQAQGIAEVNGMIGSLEQNTQHNAALVEQTAATAESLRQQAQRLEAALHGFHGVGRAHAV